MNENYHTKSTLSTKKLKDNLPAEMPTITDTTGEAGNSKTQIRGIESLDNWEANNSLNNKVIPTKDSITTRGRTTLTLRKFPDGIVSGANPTLKNTNIIK